MKCEKCGEREATFFYQKQTNGHSASGSLCQSCAAEAGLLGGVNIAKTMGNTLSSFFASDFPNLFGDIFEFTQKTPVTGRTSTTACPQCGTTWAELAKEGKMGCPTCYSTFAEQLSHSIRSMHGNATHTGRAPAKRQAALEKKTRLENLKKNLKAAIESENFEEAARLRDEIRAITDGEKE